MLIEETNEHDPKPDQDNTSMDTLSTVSDPLSAGNEPQAYQAVSTSSDDEQDVQDDKQLPFLMLFQDLPVEQRNSAILFAAENLRVPLDHQQGALVGLILRDQGLVSKKALQNAAVIVKITHDSLKKASQDMVQDTQDKITVLLDLYLTGFISEKELNATLKLIKKGDDIPAALLIKARAAQDAKLAQQAQEQQQSAIAENIAWLEQMLHSNNITQKDMDAAIALVNNGQAIPEDLIQKAQDNQAQKQKQQANMAVLRQKIFSKEGISEDALTEAMRTVIAGGSLAVKPTTQEAKADEAPPLLPAKRIHDPDNFAFWTLTHQNIRDLIFQQLSFPDKFLYCIAAIFYRSWLDDVVMSKAFLPQQQINPYASVDTIQDNLERARVGMFMVSNESANYRGPLFSSMCIAIATAMQRILAIFIAKLQFVLANSPKEPEKPSPEKRIQIALVRHKAVESHEAFLLGLLKQVLNTICEGDKVFSIIFNQLLSVGPNSEDLHSADTLLDQLKAHGTIVCDTENLHTHLTALHAAKLILEQTIAQAQANYRENPVEFPANQMVYLKGSTLTLTEAMQEVEKAIVVASEIARGNIPQAQAILEHLKVHDKLGNYKGIAPSVSVLQTTRLILLQQKSTERNLEQPTGAIDDYAAVASVEAPSEVSFTDRALKIVEDAIKAMKPTMRDQIGYRDDAPPEVGNIDHDSAFFIQYNEAQLTEIFGCKKRLSLLGSETFWQHQRNACQKALESVKQFVPPNEALDTLRDQQIRDLGNILITLQERIDSNRILVNMQNMQLSLDPLYINEIQDTLKASNMMELATYPSMYWLMADDQIARAIQSAKNNRELPFALQGKILESLFSLRNTMGLMRNAVVEYKMANPEKGRAILQPSAAHQTLLTQILIAEGKLPGDPREEKDIEISVEAIAEALGENRRKVEAFHKALRLEAVQAEPTEMERILAQVTPQSPPGDTSIRYLADRKLSAEDKANKGNTVLARHLFETALFRTDLTSLTKHAQIWLDQCSHADEPLYVGSPTFWDTYTAAIPDLAMAKSVLSQFHDLATLTHAACDVLFQSQKPAKGDLRLAYLIRHTYVLYYNQDNQQLELYFVDKDSKDPVQVELAGDANIQNTLACMTLLMSCDSEGRQQFRQIPRADVLQGLLQEALSLLPDKDLAQVIESPLATLDETLSKILNMEKYEVDTLPVNQLLKKLAKATGYSVAQCQRLLLDPLEAIVALNLKMSPEQLTESLTTPVAGLLRRQLNLKPNQIQELLQNPYKALSTGVVKVTTQQMQALLQHPMFAAGEPVALTATQLDDVTRMTRDLHQCPIQSLQVGAYRQQLNDYIRVMRECHALAAAQQAELTTPAFRAKLSKSYTALFQRSLAQPSNMLADAIKTLKIPLAIFDDGLRTLTQDELSAFAPMPCSAMILASIPAVNMRSNALSLAMNRGTKIADNLNGFLDKYLLGEDLSDLEEDCMMLAEHFRWLQQARRTDLDAIQALSPATANLTTSAIRKLDVFVATIKLLSGLPTDKPYIDILRLVRLDGDAFAKKINELALQRPQIGDENQVAGDESQFAAYDALLQAFQLDPSLDAELVVFNGLKKERSKEYNARLNEEKNRESREDLQIKLKLEFSDEFNKRLDKNPILRFALFVDRCRTCLHDLYSQKYTNFAVAKIIATFPKNPKTGAMDLQAKSILDFALGDEKAFDKGVEALDNLNQSGALVGSPAIWQENLDTCRKILDSLTLPPELERDLKEFLDQGRALEEVQNPKLRYAVWVSERRERILKLMQPLNWLCVTSQYQLFLLNNPDFLNKSTSGQRSMRAEFLSNLKIIHSEDSVAQKQAHQLYDALPFGRPRSVLGIKDKMMEAPVTREFSEDEVAPMSRLLNGQRLLVKHICDAQQEAARHAALPTRARVTMFGSSPVREADAAPQASAARTGVMFPPAPPTVAKPAAPTTETRLGRALTSIKKILPF